jgi:hypothetical protein
MRGRGGYRVRNSNTQMQGTLWPIDLVYWLVTGVVTNGVKEETQL